MKRFLLGTVGVVALGIAAPASAADLAARPYTKAPPPMIAAIYDWSGFYIGANGGWGTNRDNRTNDTLSVGLGSYDASGGVAGGQLGYRWQTGSWVFGLEGQGDWADLNGNSQNLFNPLNHLHSHMDAFGLLTGQVGYAWNNALFYVKGGAAVTDRKFDFVSNATGIIVSTSNYSTRWGGTAGVGFEYGFTPNWSAAIEYDHIFETRHTVSFITPAGVPLAAIYSSGGDTDLVTVRVNYRWGGPVIAKY